MKTETYEKYSDKIKIMYLLRIPLNYKEYIKYITFYFTKTSLSLLNYEKNILYFY